MSIDIQKIKSKAFTFSDRWNSIETEMMSMVQKDLEKAAAEGKMECRIDLQEYIEKFEDDIVESWWQWFCVKIEKEIQKSGLEAFMDSTDLVVSGWMKD